MKLVVKKDYEQCSRYLADMFREVVLAKPDALLGLATGSSPVGMYRCLVEDYENGMVDFSRVRTINLDEYIGLPREHEQSFGYFMDKHFFSKVNIREENIMLVDGADDAERQVARYNSFLEDNFMDILVVGIGTNGHVGFNEPDSVLTAPTHVTDLTEDTIRANSVHFEDASQVPRKAITMGAAGITRAAKVVLIASGKAKANAVKRLLADEFVDPMLPCSILKLCRDATVIIDEALYNEIRD